ncbi:unnamed protein product [Prorocentrum cordatum]|uniref:Uncharacterized protein n=1 Tax=Prorocentrum cordatum TaxID=2364126 RepID=A0ABN9YDU5_9DINO|nr:unnamed protein product [Polarella glacialis]
MPEVEARPSPREVRVQYDGREYDWPDLVGSPDIAVLQENILHYLRVPLERQADAPPTVYSRAGPVLTAADVAQELRHECPRFCVYDCGGPCRRRFPPERLVVAGQSPPLSFPLTSVLLRRWMRCGGPAGRRGGGLGRAEPVRLRRPHRARRTRGL